MVTRNFLNILAMALQSGHPMGCLQVHDVNGNSRFLSGIPGFPDSPTKSFTLNAAAAGISIGTGSTPATEDDFQLEEPITSGVTVTLTGTEYGAESPWYPYVKFDLTITNTGANPLVVTEVGYKQTVYATRYIGSTARADTIVLIDRCVLDTPVTIAPGDAGIVTYRLQTNPVPVPPSVAGVQMASFSYGTDAQIAAILDAAQAGTIDLQRDAGWKVGDQRLINIAAFTAGGNVAVPAQKIAIVITSFDEYMECGNVMQFDFACCLSKTVRMSSAGTTNGGYGASEMKTVTLPALVEALPDWLKTRLKTFSVLAGSGGTTQTIETVTGNKLALRSEVEMFGVTPNSPAGEGTQVEYYKGGDGLRVKTLGLVGSTNYWWERSAGSSYYFCTVTETGAPYVGYNPATAFGVSPFGCL